MSGRLLPRRTRQRALLAVSVALGGFLAFRLLPRTDDAPRAARVADGDATVDPPRLAPAPRRARSTRAAEPTAPASGPAGATPAPGDAEQTTSTKSARTIPLTTRIVDPDTGISLDAQWSMRSWVDALGRKDPVPDAEMASAFRPSGQVGYREIAVAGHWVDVALTRVPEGRVYVQHTLIAEIAADAVSASLVIPAWHEIPLDVQIVDEGGRPRVDAEVAGLEVAGSQLPWRVEALGGGVYRVRGIPFLPDEEVMVPVRTRPSPSDGAPASAVETASGGVVTVTLRATSARTTVPFDRYAPWTVTVVLPRGNLVDAVLSDHVETDNDLPVEESLGEGGEDGRAAHGSVRVRLLGPQGRPIVGGIARLAGAALPPTDAEGVAALERVRAGTQLVTAKIAGRFPLSGSVTVRDGAPSEIVLREPVGATIDLIMSDADDRPLPFANFFVQGGVVFDVHDGDQRLDPYTDEHGRRTLARVQPGRLVIQGSWGSRSNTIVVTVRDRERRTVRLVLD